MAFQLNIKRDNDLDLPEAYAMVSRVEFVYGDDGKSYINPTIQIFANKASRNANKQPIQVLSSNVMEVFDEDMGNVSKSDAKTIKKLAYVKLKQTDNYKTSEDV
jgi:uncharacterized protein (UPF0218 family)